MGIFDGKTLLELGTSIGSVDIVNYAKKEGANVIVTDYLPTSKSVAKQYADETAMISTLDVDKLIQFAKEKNVDGVFCGVSEPNLQSTRQVAEALGLPCYFTKEQWDQLQNKIRFKEICEKYGVLTPTEFLLSDTPSEEELSAVKYPVVVKPADESSGKGVKRCNNEEELKRYYNEAKKYSDCKNILCEKYMDSSNEIFLNYTIQDGYCSLSATYMNHQALSEKNTSASAILHVYSSSYLDLYRKNAEPAVINMLKGIGLKNAFVSLQAFIDGQKFYFHDVGLRLGGGQSYLFTDRLNGINAAHLMVEYALTGKMKAEDAKLKDNPVFEKVCCNYYVSLKPGKITSIEGIHDVKSMPQILYVNEFHGVGNEIKNTSSLERVIYRLHVMDETKEKMAKTLEKISNTLNIEDEYGNEMQIERLTYDRALEMIENS